MLTPPPPSPNSQPELLERLDGEEGRGGVPLLDLHLVPVLHQGAADELVEERLLGQVHTLRVLLPTSIFAFNVACAGAQKKD